jgi:hypothetical protein
MWAFSAGRVRSSAHGVEIVTRSSLLPGTSGASVGVVEDLENAVLGWEGTGIGDLRGILPPVAREQAPESGFHAGQ